MPAKEYRSTDPIVADAYALFLAFGGCQHRKIEAAMRAKGYEHFSRRVFHDRLDRGKLRLGWIRKFNWHIRGSEPPALVGGMTRGRLAVSKNTPAWSEDAPVSNSKPANTSESKQSKANGAENNSVAAPTLSIQEKTRLARADFKKWLKRASPNMCWNWAHHEYLYSKLAEVTSGKTKRLMIFMPPRHGKSELVTVRYAAWRIQRDPALNVIIGSYNQRLANRFSRKVRITWEDSTQTDNSELRMENEDDHVSSPHVSKGSTFPTKQNGPNETSSTNSQFSTINSQLRPTSRARLNTVSEWETGLGGGVRAVGVGAGITGYGGKLVIIDDPVKSRGEAESETYRNRVWEWFNDDLYTRLEPGASMILIQTRWHEDDLAGRLLQEMENGGEKWEVVSLPAIAEKISPSPTPKDQNAADPTAGNTSVSEHADITGSTATVSRRADATGGNATVRERASTGPNAKPNTEDSPTTTLIPPSNLLPPEILAMIDPIGRLPGDALCPERFPLRELTRIRRQLGEYSFAALYQQRPMPLEGGLFKKKWFRQIVDRAPEGLRWFRGYDLAISTKTSADYTATARCAIDRHGNLYIADVFRARLEYPEQRKLVVDRLTKERDTEHGIESALHAQAFIQDLRREPSLARHAIRLVRVTNDKFTRSLAWANRAEEGKVILVRGPWLNQFLDEVCSFPNSPHDDQVDAVSLSVQMIDMRKRQFWRFCLIDLYSINHARSRYGFVTPQCKNIHRVKNRSIL
jgi:predicted phage terminase large subunit-like protein